MILIELNGERQLVESLDGYDGWTVVESDVSKQTSDFAQREGGEWVEDTAKKDEADRNAMLMAMTRAEFADYIIAEAKRTT